MSKQKILIIEDDQSVVDSLVALLKNDFEVDYANNGNAGLEKVKSFGPNLIILDLMMPEKDGFDVCQRLKKDEAYKNVPVIALSSFTEMYDMRFGTDETKSMLPSEIYLSKPLDPPTLLREIKEQLNK